MPKLTSKKSLKDKICPALFLYYKKNNAFFSSGNQSKLSQ